MDILNYSSYLKDEDLLRVRGFRELIEKTTFDKDMRAILIRPSKVVRNSEHLLKDKERLTLKSIFIKHNFLNETDVTSLFFEKEEDFENLFLKSFYSSLKYSFLDIPFSGSTLGLILNENVNFQDEKVKKKLGTLLVKNFSEILDEQNYLKINDYEEERKDSIIKLIENLDRPRISKRFKFLLKNPLRKKIVKEKYDLLWLKSLVKYFFKGNRVRVIIDTINKRSLDFLKEIVKDEFFFVVGIGSKDYSYYSSKGICWNDINIIENREETQNCIDYTDLLKKETELFLEFGTNYNFNETMSKLVNCRLFGEFEDLSTSFQSIKDLTKRKIIYLPSLLLDSVDQIFDYFEIIERKREEMMSIDEIELRFETYIKFVLSYFDSFLEDEQKVFEIFLSRAFENYRKKFSLVYG
ncbi:MAG: hypothetical protein ABIN05_06810 [candidate division WOR-3 bacterium]